jgi:D-alanyl-D-alanine carboxypeptidase
MKNFFNRILIGLLLLCSYTNVKSETPVDTALANALQNKIESYISLYSIPGISVTIFLPGERVWSGAAGLSHIYNMTPMDTSHLFEMASTTKMYTAAIIFQLMEEGQLSLDDTVGKYLPPMNYVPSGTTIRNMLKHRSGLYNYTNNSSIGNEWFNHPDSIWPHLQMINTFVNSPPLFPQGSSYSYSNTNFFLLGMIIEAITGNNFADELKSRILVPNGLSQIYFPPNDIIPAT